MSEAHTSELVTFIVAFILSFALTSIAYRLGKRK
jgi:heme/copper-type cytochrome/quinol oxidase subunit 4